MEARHLDVQEVIILVHQHRSDLQVRGESYNENQMNKIDQRHDVLSEVAVEVARMLRIVHKAANVLANRKTLINQAQLKAHLALVVEVNIQVPTLTKNSKTYFHVTFISFCFE